MSDVQIVKVVVPSGTSYAEVARLAEEEARKQVNPNDWIVNVTPLSGVAFGGPFSNDMQWTVEYQVLPPGGTVAKSR